MQSLSNVDVKMDQGHRNHSIAYAQVCQYLPHSTLVRVLWQGWQSNIRVIEGTLSFIDCTGETPKKDTCLVLSDIKQEMSFMMTPFNRFQWIVPFLAKFLSGRIPSASLYFYHEIGPTKSFLSFPTEMDDSGDSGNFSRIF